MTFRERLKKAEKPLLIGIAGDSGSGKTTYSNGIRRLLGIDLVETITMDGYHKENRQQRKQSGRLPLDPQANKLDLLLEHLEKIKEGRQVEVPIYNHNSGDFDPPVSFSPSPIVIIEGLHALYPEFLPFYDFTVYVDPSRDIKWEWKYKRDVKNRHHLEQELQREMFLRESAYKRYIDFQKTDADIVIKINHSRITDFAKYELTSEMPQDCYKVELIIKPFEQKIADLHMVLNFSDILSPDKPPFLLSAVPSFYWGKKTIVVHLDGILQESALKSLEEHIVSLTGIEVDEMFKQKPQTRQHELLTAVQFAQLLIGWGFLEQVDKKLSK